MPSIPELMKRHGVSNGVARKVLRALVHERLAIARAGAGTYVRKVPTIRHLVRSWHQNARGGALRFDDGLTIGSIGYESRTVHGSPGVRERLSLEMRSDDTRRDLMQTSYVRKAGDQVVFLETSWEPRELTAGTVIALPEEGPHAGRSVRERMRQIGVEVTHAPEVVSARPATTDEAHQLGIGPGDIVLVIERTHYADDRPVETADIVIPVERYQLVYGLSSWDEPAGE